MLVPRIVAGSLFFAAVVAIAAVAAWPIYRDWSFLLLVGVCSLVAAAIAALAWSRHWGGWRVAGLVAIAFFVLGIPLAVPSRLGSPLEFAPRARRRRSRRAVRVEGPGHGRSARRHVPQSARARAHRLPRRAPARACCCRGGRPASAYARGAGRARDGLVRAVLRPHDRERAARHRARRDLRARRDRARHRRPAREPAVAGVAQSRRADAVAAACRGIQRRSRLAPALAGRPASHRARSGDARRRRDRGRGGRAVRRAGGRTRRAARERRTRARCVVGGQPARAVPVAVRRRAGRRRPVHGVLDAALFPSACGWPRSTATTARSTAAAARGLSIRPASSVCPRRWMPARARPVDVEVTIEQLDGIWMPTIGQLGIGRLLGRARGVARRPVLLPRGCGGGRADRRRRPDRRRRLSTCGGRAGDARPRVDRGAGRPRRRDRGARQPAHLGRRARVGLGRCGSGRARDARCASGATSATRSRSATETPLWMQSLPDYTFQPSASGHSLARIDAMFARLLERETDPRAAASENFVAAVGDDEQFATAVALIARELGFPARVVVGARLTLGRLRAAHVRRRRVPRAGPGRVDRGAVRRRASGYRSTSRRSTRSRRASR